tara:strand:+ start:316 stop:462 length:147 start_codon:yes stop_codon:yes gene_type:complete
LCESLCFAREYELSIEYMQLKDPQGFYTKRIIKAGLGADSYDFDTERT